MANKSASQEEGLFIRQVQGTTTKKKIVSFATGKAPKRNAQINVS